MLLLALARVGPGGMAAQPEAGAGRVGPGSPAVPGRVLVVRVIDADTRQPIAGVSVNHPGIIAGPTSSGAKQQPPMTDAKGEIAIPLVLPPVEALTRMTDFSLYLEHPNYSPRIAQWRAENGGVMNDVPSDYTVKMQKGITIGGTVRDDQGAALRNARILIMAQDQTGFSVGTGERTLREYSYFNTWALEPGAPKAITTDANGRWEAPNFPRDLEMVRLTIIRDDGSDAAYATSQERFGGAQNAKLVPLADLRAGRAVLTLATGFIVRGRILNAEGKPLAGAKITEAFGMGSPQPRGQAVSDADGRFHFKNRRARQAIWAVDAPGYALTCEVITMKPDLPETVVRLQPAQGAVLHAFLADGKPAVDAEVRTLDWRNEGMYLNFSGRTDAKGVLIWTNAPLQPVRATISHGASGGIRYLRLQGGQEERITFGDSSAGEIQLSVRAVRASDQQVLERFEVQLDKEYARQFPPWIQGTNGLAKGALRLADFRPGSYPQFLLRVVSKGFLPKELELLDFNDGDRELEVALEPDTPLKGIVKLPEGTPAEQAWLVVNRDQGSIFLNQQFQRGAVKPPSYGNLIRAQTSAEGAYELEGVGRDAMVVVMHASGYAQVASSQLRTNGTITLQPWERLEGILKIGDQPAKAGLRVGLNLREIVNGCMGIYFDATTDDEGRFAFDRIPAGPYLLYRYLDNLPGTIVHSHRQDVDVLPGKVAQVEMGGRGVRVIGRAKPSNYVDLDWTVNKHTLTAKDAIPSANAPGAPVWEDFVRRADFEAANRGRIDSNIPSRQYQLTFDKDGSFFVDDVLPGEYALDIKVTEPPPRGRPWMEGGKLIGAVSTNVVVVATPGVKQFQLNPVVLPIAGAGPGAVVPQLVGRTLDGKPLELAGRTGARQALYFWAPWSGQSCQGLRQFQEAGVAGGIVKVAVAVEENEAEIKKAAAEAQWKGTLATLTGAEVIKAYASHGLRELPLILIVDGEGHLLLKTSNVARLKDALADADSPAVSTR